MYVHLIIQKCYEIESESALSSSDSPAGFLRGGVCVGWEDVTSKAEEEGH